MKTGTIITSNNKRLKQLVHDHGDQWEIISMPKPLQCYNNNIGIKVRSLDGLHERWVLFPQEISVNMES